MVRLERAVDPGPAFRAKSRCRSANHERCFGFAQPDQEKWTACRSFFFHQAHHHLLQPEPFFLKLFCVPGRLDAERRPENEAHFAEGARHTETVPTFEAATAREFH